MRLTWDEYRALPGVSPEGRQEVPPYLRMAETWLESENEREFQSHVTHLATLRGWHHYHTHDSRRSPEGFPDLVLVRDRVLYREIKTAKGRVSEAQRKWLDALKGARQDAKVWRPNDWIEILDTLF